MSELLAQLMDERSKERNLLSSIRKVEEEIQTVEEEIKYKEGTLDSDIEERRDEYIQKETERIKAEHEPLIEKANAVVEELQNELGSETVDESEELLEARERQEYLNTAARVINRFYQELKRDNSDYFIGLARTDEFMTAKKFRVAFKTIPERVLELEAYRMTPLKPFNRVSKLEDKHGPNLATYLTSTVFSFAVLFSLPTSLNHAMKRANYMHESAGLYYKLMNTLVILKDSTDKEINSLFSSLLELRIQALNKKLQEALQNVELLEDQMQKELEGIEYDDGAARGKASMEMLSLKSKLNDLNEKLDTLETQLEVTRELIAKLHEEKLIYLENERNSFLLSNPERAVVIPEKLIYDHTSESNSYFNVQHGLYLYEDRDAVSSFIQLMMFQLRNVMEWGSVQFRVLDLLGGEFASPLQLPVSGKANVQDIVISTLQEERKLVIDAMHDLLTRRKTRVYSIVKDIGEYNLLQKESGSSVLPYQFIFILVNDSLRLDEKLIQLAHHGSKLGLLVFMFYLQEDFDAALAKNVEPYFSAYITLSDRGLTTHDPERYRSALESKKRDR